MEYLQRAVVRCNRAAPPGGEMTEPLGEADTDFGALSLRRRIQLLHLVCECRVCASDVCDKIKVRCGLGGRGYGGYKEPDMFV